MKVIPEKVFVQLNAAASELVVIMDGFRLTLSKSESEALRDGLTFGLKRLEGGGEPRRPTLIGGAEHEPAPESRSMASSS